MEIFWRWKKAVSVVFEEDGNSILGDVLEHVVEMKAERIIVDYFSSYFQNNGVGVCGKGEKLGKESGGCGRVAWRFTYRPPKDPYSLGGLRGGVEVCRVCPVCFWNKRMWRLTVEMRLRTLPYIEAEYQEEDLDCESGLCGMEEAQGSWRPGGSQEDAVIQSSMDDVVGVNAPLLLDALPQPLRKALEEVGDTIYADGKTLRSLIDVARQDSNGDSSLSFVVRKPHQHYDSSSVNIRQARERIGRCEWLSLKEIQGFGPVTTKDLLMLQKKKAMEVYAEHLAYERECYRLNFIPEASVVDGYPEPLRAERQRLREQAVARARIQAKTQA